MLGIVALPLPLLLLLLLLLLLQAGRHEAAMA
jgi:hypothetical protein